jgi:hypothetical protein
MRLERGCYSDLDSDVLGALLGRLSLDPSSVDFNTPLAVYTPMSSAQATRTRLLRELSMLDVIDIIAWQRGDESQGIQIPGADVADDQGSVSTGPSSGKEKGKVIPQIVLNDTEVLSEEDDIPLQRRMRQYCSSGPLSMDPRCRGSRLLGRPPHRSPTQGWRCRRYLTAPAATSLPQQQGRS